MTSPPDPIPMVTDFSVSGFKSLRDCAVSLGRVNVLIGPNGAGKSNLLEAIGMLGAATFGRVDDEALIRRGVRPGPPSLYKSSFHGGRLPADIGLGACLGEYGVHVRLGEPRRTRSSAWTFVQELLKRHQDAMLTRSLDNTGMPDLEAGLLALEMLHLPPNSPPSCLLSALRDYAIYSPHTPFLRGLVRDPVRPPLGLGGGGLAEAFAEVLSLTTEEERGDYLRFIPWARGVKARPAGEVPLSASVASPQQVLTFEDRFMAEGRNHLTAHDASEGALFVLFAMVSALHPDMPRLFAIDNFDHGIHPVLGRALLEQLSTWILDRQDRQVLLTVQNPTLLDGLPFSHPDVRLFIVDRLSNGETNLRPLVVTPHLLELAGQGWTLSRMWVSGEIGGVPDV